MKRGQKSMALFPGHMYVIEYSVIQRIMSADKDKGDDFKSQIKRNRFTKMKVRKGGWSLIKRADGICKYHYQMIDNIRTMTSKPDVFNPSDGFQKFD